MNNSLTTVATPPYWCTAMVNKLVASFAWNMVLCLIVGCGTKSGRDKELYFSRVPSVATNQGVEAKEVSKERRRRDYLTEEMIENDRVCEKHFVSGRAAEGWDKYNIDWVPTLLLAQKKLLIE